MTKIIYLGYNGFKEHKRGVENVIEFQANSLDGYKYYIHWGDEYKIYKHQQFICISLNKKSSLKYLYLNLIIKKIASQKKIFIHSHNPLMSFALYKKTDLYTAHDGMAYLKSSAGIKGIKLEIFKFIEKRVFSRVKFVHFISQFTKSNTLYNLEKTNNIIIYNTTHYENFKDKFSYDKNYFEKQFPFLRDKKYFFSVRSIESRARIDLLIDLAERNPELTFVVAGKGPLLKKYEEIIEQKKIRNIFLLGYVNDNDLLYLYRYAHLIIVTCEYGEGFGLPIIEGYLFNKPVIASDKCAIPEVIIDKKFLFDNTPSSFLEIYNNIQKELFNNDYYNHYSMNFSSKIIGDQYKQLYTKLISK